jgi:hypothetical protein
MCGPAATAPKTVHAHHWEVVGGQRKRARPPADYGHSNPAIHAVSNHDTGPASLEQKHRVSNLFIDFEKQGVETIPCLHP